MLTYQLERAWMELNNAWLMLARQVLAKPYALLPVQHHLMTKPIGRRVAHRPEQPTVEIPVFAPDDLTAEHIAALAPAATPILIRGFARDIEAVQRWTPAWFSDHYGQQEVLITRADRTTFMGSLDVVLDGILSGDISGNYAQNIADMFNENPELEQDLELERVKSLMRSFSEHFGTQLFLGGPGTGAGYHCAPYFNCFIMVYGEKEWRFVSPQYTPWMYPFMPPTGLYAYSPTPAFDDSSQFPLYRVVPRWRVRMKPGDLLINPPWWWHAVKNVTHSTIGVATRWKTDISFNLWFDVLGRLSKDSRIRRRTVEKGERLSDSINLAKFHLANMTGAQAAWIRGDTSAQPGQVAKSSAASTGR